MTYMAGILDVSTIGGVPLKVKIVPSGNQNRPGYALSPKFITVHETDNTSAGAGASAHANYICNPSTTESWHFTVDEKEIYQHLPINENGWHAGDGGSGAGNRQSIGIEMCVNSDGNYEKTLNNAAALVSYLMKVTGVGIGNVYPHQHWSGKNCPRKLLARGFQSFKDKVSGNSGTTTPGGGGSGSGGGSTAVTGVATILGQNVNLRKGPGTNYEVIRKLNAPEAYKVWAEQNGWLNLGGDQWVYNDPSYIRFDRDGGGTLAPSNGERIGVVIVTTAVLNVRTQPNTSGSIVRQIKQGEDWNVYEQRNGWYRLHDGWVSGGYVTFYAK